ncbi:hypothetical protein [Catalinimonas alkaloidigena]|uniref:hypothetical protein n=1 Tax=Catalinimonas alkaloidigena TaxID=1075417 RepID=UPI002406E093|nr:hypothetical protein [Catalinimonas alkaloidigena]
MAQPIVKIGGHEDPFAMEKEVYWYLNQLGIQENIHLTVIFTSIIPKGFDGLTVSRKILGNGYQVLMVRINKALVERQQQKVLAHEMIHVKQYAKGELKLLKSNTVVWLGKKHRLSKIHHRGPWEKEAYRNDHVLAVQQRQKPDITTLASFKSKADSLVYMREVQH